jgi:type I restriction enzyme, S subunit
MNPKWHSIKAKYVLIKQRHPSSDLDGVVTAFRDGEVVLRSERRTEGFTEATEFIGYQGVRKGELVVHSMDAFAGAIGISKSDGRMSPVVHIYRGVDGVDLRFYAYYLRHLSNIGYIQSLSKGIRERSTSFDPAVLKELVLPLPPIDEQKVRADFLDNQLGVIDRTIELKMRQIACLKEESKGLTLSWLPKANSKNSDLWESTVGSRGIRAKILFKQKNVSGIEAPLASATMDGVFLREEMINDVWNPEENSEKYKLVEPEDFVIGLRSFQHGFSYSEIRGKVSPAYTVFTLRREFRKNLDPKYFSYLFQTRQFISLLDAISVGIRQGRNIPFESFANLVIPVPETTDQAEIVQLQEKNLLKINLLMKSVDAIKELKASLIASTVLGETEIKPRKASA